MLISVADFLESAIECMFTQLSLLKAFGGLRLGLRLPEFCSTCAPLITLIFTFTSSFSALVGGGGGGAAATGGVGDTAITGETAAAAAA